PHGSMYEHLLEKNYETRDYTSESAHAYALCYKCHSRNSILSDEGFQEHRRHIVDEKAPCAVCHDPHGSRNRGRLINFALTSVGPDGRGRLEYQERARGGATCFLTCHGKTHRDD
ncbi:MAG: cytochrome C, partial [Deltaproteobacteria bacterium]|nr:cytochrome C [Deltaproteobacteria bacterium]